MELRCKLIVAHIAYLFLPCILHAQFPKTIDLANFGEDVRIVYHTEDDKDGFGKDLATGDFNGDGYDDILAGAYTYSDRENLRFNVGRAYLIFGGPRLPRILDLHDARTKSVRITGDDPWDNTGFYVGAGDVNGDGFEEAIVGSIQVGSVTTPGKLYVAYGRQSWPEEFDLNTNGGAVEGITRITGKLPGDSQGSIAKSGDINGDGYDDIVSVAGNLGYDDELQKAGEVYIIYGRDSLNGIV